MFYGRNLYLVAPDDRVVESVVSVTLSDDRANGSCTAHTSVRQNT